MLKDGCTPGWVTFRGTGPSFVETYVSTLHTGSISASPTACPLSEAVISSTGAPMPAQWTCRRRCRYRADMGWRHGKADLRAKRRPTRGSTCTNHCRAGILSSMSALHRHRRRHVHCVGIGVPVLFEAVILSTGTPMPAQWTCRRRCRYRADMEC